MGDGPSPGRPGWAIRRVLTRMDRPGGYASRAAVAAGRRNAVPSPADARRRAEEVGGSSGVGGGRRQDHAGRGVRGQARCLRAGAADAGGTTALEHRTRTPCACRRTDRPTVIPGAPPCPAGRPDFRPHEHTLTNAFEAKPVRALSASAPLPVRAPRAGASLRAEVGAARIPLLSARRGGFASPATPESSSTRHPITTEEFRSCTQFWSPAVSNTA